MEWVGKKGTVYLLALTLANTCSVQEWGGGSMKAGWVGIGWGTHYQRRRISTDLLDRMQPRSRYLADQGGTLEGSVICSPMGE